jgi:16S rRNA (guanine1207-N2)-methyltransferase
MIETSNDSLPTPEGVLALVRPGGARGLRAWDAADALLLDTAHDYLREQPDARVLVVDDAFGALGLGLARARPDLVADNATLASALRANRARNPGCPPVAAPSDWRTPPSGPYDLVLLRIPRQADYLGWLLRWLNGVLAAQGRLLAGGMIKHLPDRSVALFAEAVRTDTVLPARKKARVVVCRRGEARLADWPDTWKGYRLDDGLTFEGLPAVFSRDRLDQGTRRLLPWVARAVAALPPQARMLDLACGNGILGISALVRRPDLMATFVDVSSQALMSAGHNLARACPGVDAAFLHQDGLAGSEGPFELILLNPPFHDGGAVGDHIALRLFRQAAQRLAPGGRLLLVGNRHLGYHRSLRRWFSRVRQLDADPKFVVFEAGRS